MDFVLKEKDCLAPITVANWIIEALKLENGHVVPKAKIAKACRHLADILDYQYQYGCQIPD